MDSNVWPEIKNALKQNNVLTLKYAFTFKMVLCSSIIAYKKVYGMHSTKNVVHNEVCNASNVNNCGLIVK